ncbi:hypothetical protein [Novosphingobium sp. THN1]|uniref:hypothetical protein n=1 Tax=Novosphingobium sp. THN1 TaxID=1016987 RepID=UPI001F076D71|nr:hypothetical protein [Novosphingobium sp. THN1]
MTLRLCAAVPVRFAARAFLAEFGGIDCEQADALAGHVDRVAIQCRGIAADDLRGSGERDRGKQQGKEGTQREFS